MLNWDGILSRHRLNEFSPYAGVGELGNGGWSWVLSVGFGIGVALYLIELAIIFFARQNRPVLSVALIALTLVFTLFLSQYTLRAAVRMLYYASGLTFAGLLVTGRRTSEMNEGAG